MPTDQPAPARGEYRTTLARGVGAPCVGAVVGATIVTADYVRGLLQLFGLEHVQQYGLRKGITIFVVAFVPWIAGVTLVGVPFWWLFHRLGWRGWRAATALGAALTFLVSLGITTNGFGVIQGAPGSASDSGGPTIVDGELTSHGWASAVIGSLLLGAEGMVVGWVVWRTAYRRRLR